MRQPTANLIKAIALMVVIIVILCFLEKFISKSMYREKYELPANCMKIMVKDIEMPLYVFNKKRCDCLDNYFQINKEKYKCVFIPVHFSAVLQKKINQFCYNAKNLFNVGTPISDAVYTVTTCMKVINTADITQPQNQDRQWRIYIPKNARLKCFIDYNFLYIM